jgi:hypothetical protein
MPPATSSLSINLYRPPPFLDLHVSVDTCTGEGARHPAGAQACTNSSGRLGAAEGRPLRASPTGNR